MEATRELWGFLFTDFWECLSPSCNFKLCHLIFSSNVPEAKSSDKQTQVLAKAAGLYKLCLSIRGERLICLSPDPFRVPAEKNNKHFNIFFCLTPWHVAPRLKQRQEEGKSLGQSAKTLSCQHTGCLKSPWLVSIEFGSWWCCLYF